MKRMQETLRIQRTNSFLNSLEKGARRVVVVAKGKNLTKLGKGGKRFIHGFKKMSRRNVRNTPDVCFLKAADRHKLSGTALPSDLIFAIKFLLTEPKP